MTDDGMTMTMLASLFIGIGIVDVIDDLLLMTVVAAGWMAWLLAVGRRVVDLIVVMCCMTMT